MILLLIMGFWSEKYNLHTARLQSSGDLPTPDTLMLSFTHPNLMSLLIAGDANSGHQNSQHQNMTSETLPTHSGMLPHEETGELVSHTPQVGRWKIYGPRVEFFLILDDWLDRNREDLFSDWPSYVQAQSSATQLIRKVSGTF